MLLEDLIEVNSASAGTEEFKGLVRRLAMQVAAASPQFVNKENRVLRERPADGARYSA